MALSTYLPLEQSVAGELSQPEHPHIPRPRQSGSGNPARALGALTPGARIPRLPIAMPHLPHAPRGVPRRDPRHQHLVGSNPVSPNNKSRDSIPISPRRPCGVTRNREIGILSLDFPVTESARASGRRGRGRRIGVGGHRGGARAAPAASA
jgi:hypothetical protein